MTTQALNVWLIEDNPGDARLIQEYLKETPAGDQIVLLHLNSLNELAGSDPQAACDLILLDLNLADSQGPDTLRRCMDIRPETAVIVLTGLDSETTGINAVRSGAQDYLVKDDIDPTSLGRAITYAIERVRLSQHLRQARDERHVLDAAIAQLGQGMVLVDAQMPGMPITFANQAFLGITGYELGEILGRNCRFLQGPDTDRSVVDEIRRALHLREDCSVELLNYQKDGTPFWNQLALSPVFSQDGMLTHFVGLQTDVTTRREQEEHLKLLRTAIDQANESVVISTRLDQRGSPEIVFANHAFTKLTGYESTDINGRDAVFLTGPDTDPVTINQINRSVRKGEAFHGEITGRKRDGSSFEMLLNISPVRSDHGLISHHVATQADITLRKRYEQQILHDALHDSLTGLPNRVMFNERITQALSRADRHSEFDFAVLMLDLDQFKIINESLGHSAGDQLLVEVSKRIAVVLEPGDTFARLGGDDFGIMTDDIQTPYDAARVARRIQRVLTEPVSINGHSITVSASIGIVVDSSGYSNAESIVRDADTAMYRAKNRGRAQYEIFDAELHQIAITRLTLENELRRAIANREFRVYFQPIIEIETGRLAAGEALVRWQHPTSGLVGPGYFLDVAIEAELMEEIGDFVLQEAIAAAAEWHRIAEHFGYRSPSVTVNLDERELSSPTLTDRIIRSIKQYQLEPRLLVVEVTERALGSSNPKPVQTVRELSENGIRVALDDFGVGYSTFSSLQRLPVDFLKLDRSIISTTSNRRFSDAILRSISSLTSELGIRTVAEGIESPDQLEIARDARIDLAQGFHLGFPSPLPEFSALLRERAASWNPDIAPRNFEP
jgi:diguanylate cyclase (GGDEF)-like protein/PAS domain S-box-containing protein